MVYSMLACFIFWSISSSDSAKLFVCSSCGRFFYDCILLLLSIFVCRFPISFESSRFSEIIFGFLIIGFGKRIKYNLIFNVKLKGCSLSMVCLELTSPLVFTNQVRDSGICFQCVSADSLMWAAWSQEINVNKKTAASWHLSWEKKTRSKNWYIIPNRLGGGFSRLTYSEARPLPLGILD